MDIRGKKKTFRNSRTAKHRLNSKSSMHGEPREGGVKKKAQIHAEMKNQGTRQITPVKPGWGTFI